MKWEYRTHTSTGRRKTKRELEDHMYARFRYMCPRCNRNVYIPNDQDKKLCDMCGYYVFRDKKKEFEYRMNEEMRKEK